MRLDETKEFGIAVRQDHEYDAKTKKLRRGMLFDYVGISCTAV